MRQEIVRRLLLRAEIGDLAVESAKRYAEPFGRLLALSVIFKTGERREQRNLGVLVCRAVATVGLAPNFFQNFSRIDIGHRIDSRSCRSLSTSSAVHAGAISAWSRCTRSATSSAWPSSSSARRRRVSDLSSTRTPRRRENINASTVECAAHRYVLSIISRNRGSQATRG